MNVVRYSVEKMPSDIHIGNQYEHNVTAVEIDCSEWLSRWPSGTLLVSFQAPKENTAEDIPQTQTVLNGTTFVLLIGRDMTKTEGVGSICVKLKVGNTIEKRSAVSRTHVRKNHKLPAGQT